jgi:hypothetical protein
MATTARSAVPSGEVRQRPGVRGTCPGCWRERVTVVGVDLGEGDQVELHACDFCERRTWVRNGVEVPTGDVLDTLLRTGGRRPKAPKRAR